MNEISEYLVFNLHDLTCDVCGSDLPYTVKRICVSTLLLKGVIPYSVCPYREDCTTTAKIWLSLGHYTGNSHE